jgi:peptidoglycan L-alanyl-D-glutamate endopeptidase CwlK
MLFNTVIHMHDCSVICGRRGELEQNQAFSDGKSRVEFPNSKHNKTPSMAVDVVPYPCDWDDKESFVYFGGFVMGIAAMLHYEGLMSHRLRWGGHFDGFFDGAHFELIGV